MMQLFNTKKQYIYFPSKFTENKKGIKINALIWINTVDSMKKEIQNKINNGFNCIKLKIGFNWEKELKILKSLRFLFPCEKLEIRVDANQAFNFKNIKYILDELFLLKIHSIEQPIKIKNWRLMSELCHNSPIPIALDEELLGIHSYLLKKEILKEIKPKFLVLKPSLIGGIHGTMEWIRLCNKYNINWWITSALESNIGLNFISQWVFLLNLDSPQGLSTINLFSNNYNSPLFIYRDKLFFSFNNKIKH